MDFRTEWSSWVLILLMIVISFVTYPYNASENIGMAMLHSVGVPIMTIAIACIPVLLYCYAVKMIPDIDYSIRLAFVYFVYLFAKQFIF